MSYSDGKGGNTLEIFSFAFMQRAFLAVIMVGLLCSALSFFVVLNKLSFMGAGLSHAILGGIAIGVLAGINPLYSGAVFAVAIALLIGYLSKHGKIQEDTLIGVFYSSGMALGIMLISFKQGYYPELFSFLFGNVLAVSIQDLQFLAVVMFFVLLYIVIFFKELFTISFDEELARAAGLPATTLYLGLLVCLALTIVVSVKVVGVVLASALLVIPAAAGYRLSGNYRLMLLFSLLTGLVAGLAGLFISYYLNIPSGAAIVLCASAIFFLSFLSRK
ncbi:MAG: metal ABC transporter permease [Bacillota bacterium]